ncbi:MAG TPA: hypothetical protein VEZ46_09265 [Mycobacteriales bacterium]|nr:hypothetical protein [Mycobacteriales bacterium]
MHAAAHRPGRRTPAAAACVLAAALAASGLASCSRGSTRSERHRLVAPREVTVVEADGARHAGVDGERLRPGATVLTAPAGAVALAVRGRRVVLAGDSTVAVVDGGAVDVRRGRVLVDRRRGPDLRVSAGGVTVEQFRSAAVRVERGLDLRVSALTGTAVVRSESARTAPLPALHQVTVVGAALPSAAAPLALLRDDWERATIERVVATDELLERLARDVDTGVGTAARATTVVAALAPVAGTLPAGAPASEALLPAAIGRAGRGGTPAERHAAAAALRGRGGSWGVVAALLDARGLDVARTAAVLMTAEEQGGEEPIIAIGPLVVAPPAALGTPSSATAPLPAGTGGPGSPPTGTGTGAGAATVTGTGAGTGTGSAAGSGSGDTESSTRSGTDGGAGGADEPTGGPGEPAGDGDSDDGGDSGGGGDAGGGGDGDDGGSGGGEPPAPTPTDEPLPTSAPPPPTVGSTPLPTVATTAPTTPATTAPPLPTLPTVTLTPLPLPTPSVPALP